jgi:hypothetical protein
MNANELAPHISKFVGSSGGGQWSFQIVCSACHNLGAVSASRRTIGDIKALIKAAESFASQGWSSPETPLCPNCRQQ